MASQPGQAFSALQRSRLGRDEGLTLPKILAVIAILGILTISALPAYQIYQRRAYASEASLVLTQIIHGQSRHFHQYGRFYPKDGQAMSIFHGAPSSLGNQQALEKALGIDISKDDVVDYYFQAFPGTADDFCVVVVSAPYPLFTDGTSQLIGLLDKDDRLFVSSKPAPIEVQKPDKERINANAESETTW
jgi:type II secretory pathway pseudopilin PulG